MGSGIACFRTKYSSSSLTCPKKSFLACYSRRTCSANSFDTWQRAIELILRKSSRWKLIFAFLSAHGLSANSLSIWLLECQSFSFTSALPFVSFRSLHQASFIILLSAFWSFGSLISCFLLFFKPSLSSFSLIPVSLSLQALFSFLLRVTSQKLSSVHALQPSFYKTLFSFLQVSFYEQLLALSASSFPLQPKQAYLLFPFYSFQFSLSRATSSQLIFSFVPTSSSVLLSLSKVFPTAPYWWFSTSPSALSPAATRAPIPPRSASPPSHTPFPTYVLLSLDSPSPLLSSNSPPISASLL